ncbi:MAG: restriction endonuclease subunit S [Nitrosomonas sp.]|nr:restriction endonuclease subunit S [Nitrosomonas sp.]
MELKPGYKQTEVGVIPEDWDIIKLGDFTLKVGSGITPKGGVTVYKQFGRPFMRSQNVGWGVLKLDDIVFIDDQIHNTFSDTELKKNDVLLNITGASIGRCALATNEVVGGNVNQHVCIIRTNDHLLSPTYLSRVLLSDIGQRQIDSFQAGGNREGLNFGQIKSFNISLPPTKAEQTAIANALSDADALIQSLTRLIAKKRQIKQGAMQTLLNPYENGRLKEGWMLKKLGDICENITTGKLDANAMIENGEYSFFTCAKQVYRINHFAFDYEALLVSGNGANVGYIHYFKGKFNAYQRTYVLSRFKCDVHYLKVFMERNLQNRIKVEVNAGNTPYIVMGTLTGMDVLLPENKTEQTRIATILSGMDTEIAMLEIKLAKYRQIKQGMMQNLLTGSIRLVKPESNTGAAV